MPNLLRESRRLLAWARSLPEVVIPAGLEDDLQEAIDVFQQIPVGKKCLRCEGFGIVYSNKQFNTCPICEGTGAIE